MPAGRTVQLRVGGQTYRVVSSASEEELHRFAAVVDQKLAEIVPGHDGSRGQAPGGRVVRPEAMLLAAMALAHDLEQERIRSAAMAERARGAFGRVLERVDAALGAAGEPSDRLGAAGPIALSKPLDPR
jgi:cell division protein ZapA